MRKFQDRALDRGHSENQEEYAASQFLSEIAEHFRSENNLHELSEKTAQGIQVADIGSYRFILEDKIIELQIVDDKTREIVLGYIEPENSRMRQIIGRQCDVIRINGQTFNISDSEREAGKSIAFRESSDVDSGFAKMLRSAKAELLRGEITTYKIEDQRYVSGLQSERVRELLGSWGIVVKGDMLELAPGKSEK